jgi:methyl-accepting chemotaxis protein
MLKRLKIWQKFTLIAVAFSIPIVVLSYFLLIETNKAIAYTESEHEGAEYLRPMHKLVSDVSAHRDLASQLAAGDATAKDALDKSEAEVEADLKALDAVDAQHGADLDTTDGVKAVRQQWQLVRGTALTGATAVKPEQVIEEHKVLIRGIQRLTYRVGNASNLILDPEVDSYYVADALVFKIPKLAEEVGQARATGVALLVGANAAAPEEGRSKRLTALAPLTVRIEDARDQEVEFIKFAFRYNPSVDASLAAGVTEVTQATNAFLADLTEKVIAPLQPMPAADYLASAAKPLTVTAKLWDAHMQELDRLLALRLAALNRNRMTEIGAVAVALLLTLLLLTVVVRAITRPIAHLSQIADRISLGEMDARIEIDSLDEIGELGERFRRMQVSLKAAMDALEKQGGEDVDL